jgi:maltooligosyltrehalose trehalohydrolase
MPMMRDEGDWWNVDLDLTPGVDYAFLIDGREPAIPDPRSRWQPGGVHGPSRVDDPDAFPWTDAGFRAGPLESAVLYELHVGTFSDAGTFEGAIAHLDHLVDLGITHVELMPVGEWEGDRGWGYDGVDLFAPHHAYGGPEGLRRFVDAAHARGLAVVLDVVYNHLGPSGNYLGRLGPYFTDRHASPWGRAVNFDDRGSHEVRDFVLDNARVWLRDFHVDGLRLDATHAMNDQSALHVLEEIGAVAREVAAEDGRPRAVIDECNRNDPRSVRPTDEGGFGLDAQWSDDLHHAIHVALTGERHGYYRDFRGLADVATALREGFIYQGQFSTHRGRRHGRPPAGLEGDRFVVFLQTHDQVGNRPAGERIGRLVSPARAKIGAAIVLLAPFVPMLFAGEEWAASTPFPYFTSFADPRLGEAVRQGRRREAEAFGWPASEVPDPQAPATFASAKLRWDEAATPDHAEMLDWYRRLIALRLSTPDLLDPRLDRVSVDVDPDRSWLRMLRGCVGLVLNIGGSPADVPLAGGDWTRALASGDVAIVDEGAVRLGRDSVAVLVRRSEEERHPGVER